jgi:hypothetical protein
MTTTEQNTYKKYCANVFVASCGTKYNKGDEITLTTKRGKENKHIVHNYLGMLNGNYLYSITRADGKSYQDFMQAKADRLNGFKANAEKRSNEAYESRATKHELDFLSLGEPIKVGHHSEKRHRKLFEKYDNKMRKSIEEQEKAKEYERRAEYWSNKANDVNLSMPESLEFFEFELEKAKKHHQFLKDNPDKRAHSYSLTYANNKVKDLKKKVETAIKLWATDEDIEQLNKEKEAEAKAKKLKGKKGDKLNNLINDLGGFFFFGSDVEAFKFKVKDLRDNEGEKVFHVSAGLYMPYKHKETILKSL